MLVLTRKLGERIFILTSDGPVIVSPERLGTEKCRIGIDAPPKVVIYREEILPPGAIEAHAARGTEPAG